MKEKKESNVEEENLGSLVYSKNVTWTCEIWNEGRIFEYFLRKCSIFIER